jgi:hypothetical protein
MTCTVPSEVAYASRSIVGHSAAAVHAASALSCSCVKAVAMAAAVADALGIYWRAACFSNVTSIALRAAHNCNPSAFPTTFLLHAQTAVNGCCDF